MAKSSQPHYFFTMYYPSCWQKAREDGVTHSRAAKIMAIVYNQLLLPKLRIQAAKYAQQHIATTNTVLFCKKLSSA